MAVGIYFIFLLIVEILIYSFHLSVFILLFVKRKTVFTGHFHVLFKIVVISDVLNFILTSIFQKLALIPSFMPFYEKSEYFGTIMYDSFSYVLFVILFGHVLMAFNRFTLIWFPLNYQRIWEKQWYFLILFILPFAYFGWRIFEPAKFIYLSDEKVNIVYSNPNVMALYTLTASFMNLISTFLAAIFNLLSFIKFYFYKSTTINVKERNLLFVSFITFITQFLRASFTFQQFIFPNFVELTMFFVTMYPIFNDIFALSGTVSFLILSASTRKHYKAFYLCQKHSVSSVTVLTGSSVPKITKIRRNTQMMKVTFYNQPSVSTNSVQIING